MTTGAETMPIDSNIDKENIKSVYRAIAQVSLFIAALNVNNRV